MSDPNAFPRAVLDSLPEALVAATPGGLITFVNAQALALFGYEPGELAGRLITDLVPRDPQRRADPVQWLARWAAAPDLAQSRYLDLAARRKDGAERQVEVRVRSGTVGGETLFFITLRDVTELRREQIAAKEASLRAARILMVAEDAIVSVDQDQRIVFFNPAAERMFGRTAEAVAGQPLDLLMPADARAVHAAHLEAFARSRQASRLMGERSEVLGLRADGEVFPVEATITKIQTGGQATYTAHLRDVSQRNRDRDRLAESERRIRAVFDHAADALALLSPSGVVLEINQAAFALTRDAESLAGSLLWEAPWLGGPYEGDGLKDAILAATAGTATRFQAELAKDGRTLRVDVRITPIPGPEGGVAYILAEGRYDAG